MCTVCETELKTKELSVEELGERWSYLFWECGANLRITEQFAKRGCINYTVSGLEMEEEGEYVFCKDTDDVLYEKLSVLLIFFKNQLKSIHLIPIGKNLFQERLVFKDGIILIEKVS